jgi:hypothetical protein
MRRFQLNNFGNRREQTAVFGVIMFLQEQEFAPVAAILPHRS